MELSWKDSREAPSCCGKVGSGKAASAGPVKLWESNSRNCEWNRGWLVCMGLHPCLGFLSTSQAGVSSKGLSGTLDLPSWSLIGLVVGSAIEVTDESALKGWSSSLWASF